MNKMKQNIQLKRNMLVLPYQDKKEDFTIKSMKKRFRNLLPQYIVPTVVFIGSKLSSKFQVKDRTIFSHNHDITAMVTVQKMIVLITILEKYQKNFRKGVTPPWKTYQ